MGNKFRILILTNPITFSEKKLQTYLMNLTYGGIDKVKFLEDNFCIDFIFWQTLDDNFLKNTYLPEVDYSTFDFIQNEGYEFDYGYSKEGINNIIEKYSNESYEYTHSQFEINSFFADEISKDVSDYSSGVQFKITQDYIDRIGDNDVFCFISDNAFFSQKNVFYEMYVNYKNSKLPFYTLAPFSDGFGNSFKETHMHIYFYDKLNIKPFIETINLYTNSSFSIKTSSETSKFKNIEFVETSNQVDYDINYFLKSNEFKVPSSEPGVIFSNIFWCYLIKYKNLNYDTELISFEGNEVPKYLFKSNRIAGGTEEVNGLPFFRKDYKSIDEVRVKLFEKVLDDLNLDSFNKIKRHMFLFENLLWNSLKTAIKHNKNSIEEFETYFGEGWFLPPDRTYHDSVKIIDDIKKQIENE